MEPVEFRFRIDAFSPETLPMKRLAEYMSVLADLMGEREHVHFHRLARGSAVLVQKVDFTSAPSVRERLKAAPVPDAPLELTKAYQRLDRMLANDNATATVMEHGRRAPILRFAGRNSVVSEIGPFVVQGDSVSGIVVWAGGEDKTAHVTLRDGDRTHPCEVSMDLCQQLARLLYGRPVRLTGRGKYLRRGDGSWVLESFRATDFEVLDDRPLSAALARLRPLAQGWGEDALIRLRELRDSE